VNNQKIIPATPDCLHVATAIAAQEIMKIQIPLWTFDCKDKSSKNELALIALSGKIAGKYDLEITRPK
jgi:hypothetical protein